MWTVTEQLLFQAALTLYSAKRTEYISTGVDLYVVLFGFGTWVDAATVLGGSGLGSTDTTVTYRFYSNTEKEEIAIATMSNDLSTVESIRFKDNASTPVLEPVISLSGGIQAFPSSCGGIRAF